MTGARGTRIADEDGFEVMLFATESVRTERLGTFYDNIQIALLYLAATPDCPGFLSAKASGIRFGCRREW